MLKRLWLLLATFWAGLCLYAYSTGESHLDRLKLTIALLPLALPTLLAPAARFVMSGDFRKPPAR